MKTKQIIFNIFLILGILLISEVAVSSQSTRAHYLSQLGVSSQSIQSIQNLETKLLKDFKVSSAADMRSKRAQARRAAEAQNNQSESRQTKLKLKRVASVYNKTLKKHLKPHQIAGYMSYLNASRELIHIPGGFYSPYVLGSFIRL